MANSYSTINCHTANVYLLSGYFAAQTILEAEDDLRHCSTFDMKAASSLPGSHLMAR